LLCRAPVAKKIQFWANFDLLGTPVHLHAKFHLCSLCRLPVAKKTILGKILCLGLLCLSPFTDDGQIWCAR